MAYVVTLKRSAEKELERFPSPLHDRLIERLLALKHDPRPPGAKKLRGREGYRIRVGDYRILYTVEERGKVVEVFSIAHRKEVYR
jgi:mRNA interferase RelE/StbE